jgi:hypothetical protein
MTQLSQYVRVERRFGLSARLDSDLRGTPPLTGYVMQASVRKALLTMTEAIEQAGRRAFTWTGPYGGGKSCAALLVASLVAGSKAQKSLAQDIVGPETAAQFRAAFPGGTWKAIALTGRRAPLAEDLARAAGTSLGWSEEVIRAHAQDDRALIGAIETAAKQRGGVLIVLDELGKFFEHAATTGGDIHLLQDLAERAGRSEGRIVIIGVLHQSFEQYADRLNRTARDEWAKVQGRFQNIPFVAQADEMAALIAHAVQTDAAPTSAHTLAKQAAAAVAERRPVDAEALAHTLFEAWPLHPITTLLLGPVSRQRFAQNERSVFGFLSSSEPHGFQAHLEATDAKGNHPWFYPHQLWDYLVANLGTALVVGPDGHRMSLALEAIERAALRGPLHERLVKTASLIEFYRNGSGLAVADDFLILSVPDVAESKVREALEELTDRAILIRQPRLGGYALFAGSDFDLEGELNRQTDVLDPAVLLDLPARLGLGAVAAKRHYFETGTLRTFEVVVQFGTDTGEPLDAWAKARAKQLARRSNRTSGLLVLLLPDTYAFPYDSEEAAKALGRALGASGVVAAVALGKKVALLQEHASELYALERIEQAHPQLEGDRIARREVAARRAQVTDAVRRELLAAFEGARWWNLGKRRAGLDGRGMNLVASDLADEAFEFTPTIHSELLCRDRPSTSAMAGLRALAHAMVRRSNEPDLGLTGYPAERGLYLTILSPLGLHRQEDGVWRFTDPASKGAGATLQPAWKLLAESQGRQSLETIYETWAGAPYGIKRGVMPVLALAFILAHRNSVAVYQDGFYQAVIDEVFVDRLMQSPRSVEILRTQRAGKDEALIRNLAALLSTDSMTIGEEALPVASALFQRFKALPQWSQRTAHLSLRTRKVRDIVLKANDPEALLFTDLADALADETEAAAAIADALAEAEAAYPALLRQLTLALSEHLGVDPEDFGGLGLRAATAAGVAADLRLDAFAARAGAFATGEGDIEGLASLLVHRPPRNWNDLEQEQALFELARLCRRFREAEAFAQVKGREPTTRAISVMVGVDPKDKPTIQAFAVTDQERVVAERLADEFLARIQAEARGSTIGMAALAHAVQQLSKTEPEEV